MTTLKRIISDYKKHRKYGASFLMIVFFTRGFWATFQYRIAHGFYRKIAFKPLRVFMLLFLIPWQKMIEIFTAISIPASANIGHFFGIILHSNTVVGNNCNIPQGVTIRVSGTDEGKDIPAIVISKNSSKRYL